ncbi:MAG: DUF421 domain-containing protein [Chakrabartia sp.]
MDMVLRGGSVYLILIVILRISGRRSVAQLAAFDLVLLLIVSETTQQALLGDDYSITNAVIVMTTLFVLDILMSFAKRRWPRMGVLLDGRPTLLIARGEVDARALARSRLSLDDIMAAARSDQAILHPKDIEVAVLEADGRISIIPKDKQT